MTGFSDMSNHRIAAIAALLAISVALACFVAAIAAGMNAGNSAEFKSNEAPAVRYAMSYAIDSDLYSFYKQREENDQVVLLKNDTQN